MEVFWFYTSVDAIQVNTSLESTRKGSEALTALGSKTSYTPFLCLTELNFQPATCYRRMLSTSQFLKET